MEYKKTLNLPKTDFPIKVNHKKVEEKILAFWEKEEVYGKVQDKNKGKDKYILHDGPPYPNGDIHLGHALNKVLKDIIVKYKSLKGFYSPYVPGWDCHGLPIETQMIKELGLKRAEMDTVEFRGKCKDYALKYVDIQRDEFIRLGCFGEWESPYLTLNPAYEAKIVELFGELAEKGYIYRGLKPIHWCPNCETALAEAEIEYEDEKSPSIYVKFPVEKIESTQPQFKQLIDALDPKKSFLVIWTTTPWTLPANVAIALHPDLEYVALKSGEEIYVVAEPLSQDFISRLKLKEHRALAKFKGKVLEGVLCKHPFVDREVVVVLDELVTHEQGTGCVHIAPGHGEEDYSVGLKYDLPIVMPVDDKGYFTKEGGKYSGKRFDEANKLITSDMKESGVLLHEEEVLHSYPHCWRCKKPVIFRATEQWFISVDHKNMRREALKAIGDTKWIPAWGESRIRGMVESRPDWCISRQRSWGVPIPAFYCKGCGKPLMTGKFNKAIVDLIRSEGTDGWFKKEASEILPKGTKCPDCGGTEFEKETDILDVWFESGSSHVGVLEGSKKLRWPADLYLEGSDQHRGWFQTSLLISVGSRGRAPYDAVLTHGFTVDEAGKKMSKSLGNVIDPQDVRDSYGADVLRLWVASADFRSDMSASENILKHVQEAFGKIRNTCRFLLSNLYDFDSEKDKVKYKDMLEVDKWALLRLSRLVERINKAYEDFEFHIVFHAVRDFCIIDLSALYLDIIKDRLYCGGKTSVERRSAQTVIYETLTTLLALLAPILSFTSEDIWGHLKKELGKSVFYNPFPETKKEYLDKKLEGKWEKIIAVRDNVYKALEEARVAKKIGSSLDSKALLSAKGDKKKILESMTSDLPAIFICSEVELKEGEEAYEVSKASGKKCERCWNFRQSVGKSKKHPTLCDRCEKVVEEGV